MSQTEATKDTIIPAEDKHRTFMRTLKVEQLALLNDAVYNGVMNFNHVFEDSPVPSEDLVAVIVTHNDANLSVVCNKQVLLQAELFKSLLDEGVEKSEIDLTSNGSLGTVGRQFSLLEWYCMYQLLVLYKHVEFPPDHRLNKKATNDPQIVSFIDRITRTFGRELLGTLALQCQFIGCQMVLYDLATKMALTSKNMTYEEYLEYWEIPVESVDKMCDEPLIEKVDPKTGEVTREPSMTSMERKIRRGLQTDVLFCDRKIDEKIAMRVIPPDYSQLNGKDAKKPEADESTPADEPEDEGSEEGSQNGTQDGSQDGSEEGSQVDPAEGAQEEYDGSDQSDGRGNPIGHAD